MGKLGDDAQGDAFIVPHIDVYWPPKQLGEKDLCRGCSVGALGMAFTIRAKFFCYAVDDHCCCKSIYAVPFLCLSRQTRGHTQKGFVDWLACTICNIDASTWGNS